MRRAYGLLRLALALVAGGASLVISPASGAAEPIALGVNIANAPGSLAAMQIYASQAGRNPAIIMWYQAWSEPLFYSTQLPNTQAMGALPLITWDPVADGAGIPLAQIAAGAYDSYIRSSADAAAAWKGPILIRFAHEMNLPGSVFGPGQDGNTPAAFIAAWRHVVTIFRQQGATNVEWVWSPNVDCGGLCPFTAFFPGDAWVDWVGLDGYNYSSVDDVPWMSFAQLFGSSYAALATLTSKPMMIAETSSAEQGGSKAQWIAQAFQDLPTSFPRIRAVVWFDRVKETDWTITSSPAALAAWRAVVASSANDGTSAEFLGLSPLTSDVDSASPTSPGTSTASSAPTPLVTPPLASTIAAGTTASVTTPPTSAMSGIKSPTAPTARTTVLARPKPHASKKSSRVRSSRRGREKGRARTRPKSARKLRRRRRASRLRQRH